MKRIRIFDYRNADQGSALLLAVTLIGVLTVTAIFTILERSHQLQKVGSIYRAQNVQQELTREMEVIFSNPSLCQSLVTIQGSRFTLGTPTQTLFSAARPSHPSVSAVPNITIDKMMLSNPLAVTGGLRSTFTIISRNQNDPTNTRYRSSIDAIYNPGAGGNLTSCQIVPDPKEACQEMGATWISASSRCGICEMLGGSWTGSKCTGITR